jgi:hypothetical protein
MPIPLSEKVSFVSPFGSLFVLMVTIGSLSRWRYLITLVNKFKNILSKYALAKVTDGAAEKSAFIITY